jgi:hypothetical protein
VLLQGLGGNPVPLQDEPEQQMLCPDVRVGEQSSFLLSQDEDPSGSVGEAFEHEPRVVADHLWRKGQACCGGGT